MPIECPLNTQLIADADFAELDKRVMSCCYASQNQLGRLCEERVYENDVVARLRAEGFTDIQTQVPVTVSLRSFKKVYRLDMVINGIVYELKAVEALVPAHEVQVIHYAALLGLDRIKLVNFGGKSVEGRMKRCPFAMLNRTRVTTDRTCWRPLTERCQMLAADAENCLRDWGGFLEAGLYEEALIHLYGGKAGCVLRLPVTRAGLQLGQHSVAMHAENVAFVVSALEHTDLYANELRRLIEVLPIQAWQWMNIYHANLSLITIAR